MELAKFVALAKEYAALEDDERATFDKILAGHAMDGDAADMRALKPLLRSMEKSEDDELVNEASLQLYEINEALRYQGRGNR